MSKQEQSQGRYQSLRVLPQLVDVVEQAIDNDLDPRYYPYFGEEPTEEKQSYQNRATFGNGDQGE